MFRINKNNIEIEFEYNGIKILQIDNTRKFYKDFILDNDIYIDNNVFKNKDIVYISEFNKLNEFIDLNKKSFLTKEIINKLVKYPLINEKNLEIIITEINNEFNNQLIENIPGDIHKLITLLLEFINDDFLNINNLDLILNYSFDTKKMIIFDEVSWINIEFLEKFLNQHNFIILTNDFRNYINMEKIELLLNIKNNYEYTDIIDANKLLLYLEQKINKDLLNINEIIKDKNDFTSLTIFYLIKKI